MTEKQREIIRAYKGYGDLSDEERFIPVKNEAGEVLGRLRGVGAQEAKDESLAEALALWRQKYMSSFLTRFTATKERTRNWLTNTVAKDDTRILFLVDNNENRLQGHFGLAEITEHSANVDNAIRGAKEGDPKLFLYVELALMDFGFRKLGIEKQYGELFPDNIKSVKLHRSIGFVIEKRRPLVLVSDGDESRYVDDPDIESVEITDSDAEIERAEEFAPKDNKRTLWVISMTKEEFYRRFDWIDK
jgi:hypothetical protein